MASYFDEHNLESNSIGKSSSSSEETSILLNDDVADEETDDASSMTVEVGSGIHSVDELQQMVDDVEQDENVKVEEKKEEDAGDINERQLQANRQFWAMLEVIGISREPKKCERPFSGRQQQTYEQLLHWTNRSHGLEMEKAHRQRAELDTNMAEMESVFILEGMKKHLSDMTGGSGDSKNEISPIRIWFMELDSYKSISDVYFDEDKDDEENELYAKMLTINDLCPFEPEYKPRGEDGKESLSFSTLRRQELYDIVISINNGSLRVKVKRDNKDPVIKLVTTSLKKVVKKAMAKGWGVQDLIRDCFWPYIDKLEEKIREILEKKGYSNGEEKLREILEKEGKLKK